MESEAASPGGEEAGSSEETVEIIREQFTLAWSSFKNIFTTQVFKGLLGKANLTLSTNYRISYSSQRQKATGFFYMCKRSFSNVI